MKDHALHAAEKFARDDAAYRYSRNALTHEGRKIADANPAPPSPRRPSPRARVATHPQVARETLGHAKIGIALDLFSHVLRNM